MPLVINTNVSSLNSQRQLVKSGMDLDQAMERLSSGKRVNNAADDAAGLAIANRMTSQIMGLNQSIRNANDGVSMIQTAEGALDETTNILQRMRELAIQSANGIYSDADRSTLDAEVQQLKAEIDRIAESTTFNGQPLLDGSLATVTLQVGSNANDTIPLEISGFSSSSIGGNSGDIVGVSTGAGAGNALDAMNLLLGTTGSTLIVNDTSIPSLADAAAGPTLNDKLSVINATLDGKGAEASALINIEAASAGSGVLRAGTDTLTLDVVDGDANPQSYVITGTNDLNELVAKINSETAIDAQLIEGQLVLSQAGSTSIIVTDSTTATASGIADGPTNFALVFNDISADGNGVKIEADNDAAAALVVAAGLVVNDDDGNLQGATVNAVASAEGDLILNGIPVGVIAVDGTPTAAEKTLEAIQQINLVSEQTGVVAFAGTTVAGVATTTTIALRSTDGSEISIEAGNGLTSAQLLTALGFQERNSATGSGSVASISIDTAAGAQSSLAVIDVALEQINSVRADLGAVNNRLEFTMSNLSNVVENTEASRSRIMDADFAAESAALSRAQVLQQASQAMLAQANARPQQVLQLLQG
jgi:flagellin